MLERKSINSYLNNTSKINLATVLSLIDKESNKWETEFKNLSLLILKEIGNLTYNELSKNAKSLNIKAFSIDNILKLYISKYVAEDVKAINDTTKEKLKNKIEQGLSEYQAIGQ